VTPVTRLRIEVAKVALRIELIPTLDHCIESAARQELQRSADEYMQRGNKKLERKIVLLRMFLEIADFRKLRAESERLLVEGGKVKFILTEAKGKPEYEMNVD